MRTLSILFLLVGIFLIAVNPAYPSIVTKLEDTDDGVCDIDCSLREAIATANAGDTINIPSGIYTLTLGLEFAIAKNLSLMGDGADVTIIQAATAPGAASSRVIKINSGSVTISGVTIRHGNTGSFGGGIFQLQGILNVTDSTFSGNSADRGGGIWHGSTVTITDSAFSGNSAGLGGGIRSGGTTTIDGSTISGNTASTDGGGQ